MPSDRENMNASGPPLSIPASQGPSAGKATAMGSAPTPASLAARLCDVAATHLYGWEVRIGPGDDIWSCGVTDRAVRACCRMLRALAAAPRGAEARGQVTVMKLALWHHYERFQTVVLAERDARGNVHGLLPSIAAKVATHCGPVAGRLRAGIALRGTGR